MAEIWLARQGGVAGFEKLVVIKRLIGALRDDPEHVEMFLAEARIAATLSHRNIVQVFELGDDAGSFHIVMEFIEGESVARAMKESRGRHLYVPVPIAVQLIAWAAEALHYAHTLVDAMGNARGIVHRDVSPQNLLITADGSIKVVDFGIAKLVAEDTRSGKLKGKLAYMPPEQARADPLDPRADVFSLGVVLFEMLTGTRLFGRLEELEVLKHLVTDQPFPHARDRKADVPEALDAIVHKAMSPRREDRYASAQQMQHELEGWLASTQSRITNGQVVAWLNELFPNRVAERRAVLEAARQGNAISAEAAALIAPGSSSHPGQRDDSGGPGSGSSASKARLLKGGQPQPALDPDLTEAMHAAGARRSRLPLFVAVGAVLAIVIGAIAWPRDPVVAAVPDAGVAAPATPPSGFKLSANVPAEVSVDGRVVGQTPLDFDAPPGEHTVRFAAPGMQPVEKQALVQQGHRVELNVVLEPLKVEVIDAGATATGPANPKGPKATKATGKLNLRTTPWTTVYLGKKKLGETPLVGVTVPVGNLTLRVENPEAGIKSSIEVTIVEGQTTTETLSLK